MQHPRARLQLDLLQDWPKLVHERDLCVGDCQPQPVFVVTAYISVSCGGFQF